MLHVVNGEATAHAIRTSGVLRPLNPALKESRDPDDVVAWNDVLYEGPVRTSPSPIMLAHERSQFIAAQGWEPYITIRQEFGWRDAALAKVKRQDEVVYWFESDLGDVLQLAQAIDRLAARRPESTRFSWILVDRNPADPAQHGFGDLTTEQVERLLGARQPVPEEAWPTARAFWRAFVSGDPERLMTFLSAPSPVPFLDDGVRRLLAEYPAQRSGLARSEQQILSAITEHSAATPAAVFAQIQQLELRPFMGDRQVWTRLERFAKSSPSLIERVDGEPWSSSRVDLMSLDEPDMDAFLAQEIRLTDAGHATLAGEADWLATGGAGRWIGGYEVPAADRAWRYDEATDRLVAPATGG